MGLQDNLRDIANGVKDIFSAPVGLVYDTARAITSSEYNPGFFGVFGPATEKLVTGLGSVGEGFGAGAIGRAVKDTAAGSVIRTLMDEMELIYSTEFQQQTGQVPLGLGNLGVQPGDISLQRIGATATGSSLGATALGAIQGRPVTESNPVRQWQKAATRTPGQAWVEESFVPDFYTRSVEEQDQIRNAAWYAMFSGSIDAVGRWFTDPGVIAGKGLKVARRGLWTFTPDKANAKLIRRQPSHFKEIKRLGYQVGDELEPVDGVRMMQLKDGKYDTVYHVTRHSALQQIQEEGVLRIPPGADEVLDSDLTYKTMTDKATDLTGSPTATLDFDALNQEIGTRFGEIGDILDVYLEEGFLDGNDLREIAEFVQRNPEDSLVVYYTAKAFSAQEGLDPQLQNALVLNGLVGYIDPQRITDPDLFQRWTTFAQGMFEALADGDADAMEQLYHTLRLGGASDNFLNDALLGVVNAQAARTMDTINTEFAGRGLLGSRAVNLGRSPRFPGTAARPLFLLAEGDYEEALRYASALYHADPADMPVILSIKADGLPVVFENFDLPTLPDIRSGLPQDASLFTLADRIGPEYIQEVIRVGVEELDPAVSLGKVDLSYLEPTGRMHERLFNPDGSPIEPDQIVRFEEIADDFITASSLWADNPVDAEKFLLTRQRQRNRQLFSDQLGFAENAANHKTTQAYLNWMEGKSGLEIRRVLFPDVPFGAQIADNLANAASYEERRVILLASMGYKLPEFEGLQPVLKAKLALLMDEADRVKSGAPPDERLQAMMGMESRFRDIPPAEMGAAFDEAIAELQDQAAANRFLERISTMKPVRELRMPVLRRATAVVRRTSFYQESPLARPIRAVSEWRPHQFVNVRDPMSDIQVVRQLEEARPLGIGKDTVDRFWTDYVNAGNDQERLLVLEQIDNHILTKAAEKAGMSNRELEEAIRQSRLGKQRVGEFLESRRYAVGGRDQVRFYDPDTGEAVVLTLPILSTQTQAWAPLGNVKEIIAQANNIGRIRRRIGSVPAEVMQSFYQIWKPTVLLRGGWMLRVVSDEQLRILARGGSILKHLAAIEAGETPKFTGLFQKDLTGGQRVAEGFALATGTRPLTALSTRLAGGLAKGADNLGLIDPEYMAFIKEAGLENLVSARATFGGPSESTLHSLQALIGRDEFTFLDHLYEKGTGQWRSITNGDRLFGAAWQRVLTDQFGRDPLGRHVIQEILALVEVDGFIDDPQMLHIQQSVKRFLTDTADGREIAERMPWRSRNPEKWAEDLVETLADYTAGFDESLMRGALDQKITPEMLEAIDEALRPDIVHAEIVEQTLGSSSVIRFIQDFTSGSFELMGRLPTDTLSRQPFFKHMYAGEMQRLRRLHVQQGLDFTESAISQMSESARQFAIVETKNLLYDLAEVSRFGDMVRFIMPFYPAWQEVLKVWGKLAIDDPSIIARANLLWQAPNRAGLVYTDDEGEEYIQFRLSEKSSEALGLTGWKKYVGEGGVRFGKASFNLVLNSPLPGVGPLIQYPVNEVVKKKPELEDALRWLLPFGVTSDATQIFLSPLVRQLKGEIEGPQAERSYQRAFIDALTWMDVEYRAGRRTVPPTEKEAHDIASKLWTMRLFTRLGAPAQPIFDSPLQPYIDIYRDMQDNLGPETADETFLNEYGQEFFAVTLSRTVSKTGIPPTVEAEVARRQFTELIENYPEYGRLIIGDEALGEFSSAAFAAQLQRPLDPDNPFSEVERVYRAAEIDPRTGGIMEVDRRLGWQEYIQAMDLIDLERKRRGLPSLRVRGAEDLADAKRAVTQFIAQKYPQWWEDFNTRDDLKWNKRLEAFNDISKDTAIGNRADIAGLQVYLEARQIILQELNRRKMLGGASTLEAVSNQDLANAWEALVTQILDENIAFGPLYYRYLEGDPVRLR